MGEPRETRGRKGWTDRSLGRGAVGWGLGRAGRRKRARLRGKETWSQEQSQNPTGRRVEAKKDRWLRGVGEPGGMAGGGTEREGEAGKEPPRTTRPH